MYQVDYGKMCILCVEADDHDVINGQQKWWCLFVVICIHYKYIL